MYKDCQAATSNPVWWEENFTSSFRLTESRVYQRLFRTNRRLFDPLWKVVMDSVKLGDRVLDADCGLGQWVLLLNDYGVPAVGLDFSEGMLGTLRQRAPHVEWLSGRIQAIPAESERFDAVLSWGVIEHDEAGPQAALREFGGC